MHRDINIPRPPCFCDYEIHFSFVFIRRNRNSTPLSTKTKANPTKEAKTTANLIFQLKKDN